MTNQPVRPVIEDERLLDGGAEVILAPLQGKDRRRGLPKDLFERRPLRFTVKFVFAVTLIVSGYLTIALSLAGWAGIALAIVVLGLAYAHLVELQHETLHEHAYRSRRLNRIFGFLCGLLMLSSFSHYKFEHLRHHAFLGTPQNTEFFNYRFHNLDSLRGFAAAAFHLGRYPDVLRNIVRSLLGRPIPGVNRDRDARRIRTEYRLFAIGLIGVATVSVVTGSYLMVLAWLLPALLVAEAAHFMIELPEHFGLNSQTDPNVLTNTRSIDASRLAQWYTNYNNLHTAHHYHQGVPMARVARLHTMARDGFQVVESSYPSFYLKVIRGELRYQDWTETCMTR
jgi:fatty acid desaturase